jgi:hypothetical protein
MESNCDQVISSTGTADALDPDRIVPAVVAVRGPQVQALTIAPQIIVATHVRHRASPRSCFLYPERSHIAIRSDERAKSASLPVSTSKNTKNSVGMSKKPDGDCCQDLPVVPVG